MSPRDVQQCFLVEIRVKRLWFIVLDEWPKLEAVMEAYAPQLVAAGLTQEEALNFLWNTYRANIGAADWPKLPSALWFRRFKRWASS